MFCPRCGRAVNETSNFCGGCGLSRAEIEKYMVKTEAAQPQPEVKTSEVSLLLVWGGGIHPTADITSKISVVMVNLSWGLKSVSL